MRGVNTNMTISAPSGLNPREKALEDYRKRLKEHKELSAKLKQSKLKYLIKLSLIYMIISIIFFPFFLIVSEESKTLSKDYDKSENDLKALQSVGQVK